MTPSAFGPAVDWARQVEAADRARTAALIADLRAAVLRPATCNSCGIIGGHQELCPVRVYRTEMDRMAEE